MGRARTRKGGWPCRYANTAIGVTGGGGASGGRYRSRSGGRCCRPRCAAEDSTSRHCEPFRNAGSWPGGMARSNMTTSMIASSATRRAPSAAPATSIGNADIGTDHFVEGQPQQRTEHGTGSHEDRHDHDPRLRRRHFQIGREQRRDARRRHHGDAHPGDISEDRRQAAQQPRHEAHDDGDEQADVDREVEPVGREKRGHCDLSGREDQPAFGAL